MELGKKQKANKEANTCDWDKQLSLPENIYNGIYNTANKTISSLTDLADTATDYDNTIPLALGSLTSLAALLLYQKKNNEKIKENNDNNEELQSELIEEENLLAQSENGEMLNGDIEIQSKFMQYAIEHLNNIGDSISIPIQNGQGKVTIKRIADLDINREGYKVAK